MLAGARPNAKPGRGLGGANADAPMPDEPHLPQRAGSVTNGAGLPPTHTCRSTNHPAN